MCDDRLVFENVEVGMEIDSNYEESPIMGRVEITRSGKHLVVAVTPYGESEEKCHVVPVESFLGVFGPDITRDHSPNAFR